MVEWKAWTPERTLELRKYWADGLSGSEIGMRLGGVSRCAVLGKVHRLNLPGRETVVRKLKRRMNRHPTKSSPRGPQSWSQRTAAMLSTLVTLPLPIPRPDDLARVSVTDLTDKHCRFIPGDPRNVPIRDPLYCGLDAVKGLSWCAGHAGACFQPPEVRRRPVHKYAPPLGLDHLKIVEEFAT